MHNMSIPVFALFVLSGIALVSGTFFDAPGMFSAGVYVGWLASAAALILFILFLAELVYRLFKGELATFLKRSYLPVVNILLTLAGGWWITGGRIV